MKLEDLRVECENIDLDKYISYREDIKKNMEHPDWLGDFLKSDLEYLLNNCSKIWIFYNGEEYVSSMMLIPSDEKSINKFGLNLDYKDVVDYGPMFVNPNYRGNKLQAQMLEYLNNYSKKLGYKYAAGTIHPDNIFSINNLVNDGFKYIDTKEFTRGTRNIYLKDL